MKQLRLCIYTYYLLVILIESFRHSAAVCRRSECFRCVGAYAVGEASNKPRVGLWCITAALHSALHCECMILHMVAVALDFLDFSTVRVNGFQINECDCVDHDSLLGQQRDNTGCAPNRSAYQSLRTYIVRTSIHSAPRFSFTLLTFPTFSCFSTELVSPIVLFKVIHDGATLAKHRFDLTWCGDTCEVAFVPGDGGIIPSKEFCSRWIVASTSLKW